MADNQLFEKVCNFFLLQSQIMILIKSFPIKLVQKLFIVNCFGLIVTTRIKLTNFYV